MYRKSFKVAPLIVLSSVQLSCYLSGTNLEFPVLCKASKHHAGEPDRACNHGWLAHWLAKQSGQCHCRAGSVAADCCCPRGILAGPDQTWQEPGYQSWRISSPCPKLPSNPVASCVRLAVGICPSTVSVIRATGDRLTEGRDEGPPFDTPIESLCRPWHPKQTPLTGQTNPTVRNIRRHPYEESPHELHSPQWPLLKCARVFRNG